MAIAGYIAYNFVIGAYSYWGPKAGYNIYHMVSSYENDKLAVLLCRKMDECAAQ